MVSCYRHMTEGLQTHDIMLQTDRRHMTIERRLLRSPPNVRLCANISRALCSQLRALHTVHTALCSQLSTLCSQLCALCGISKKYRVGIG